MTNQYQIYKHSLANWKGYEAYFCGKVLVTWTDADLMLDWQETFSIDESPANDRWDTPATHFKQWQEDLYKTWGYVKSATQHYMAFEPKLDFDIAGALSMAGSNSGQHCMNLIKIPAGRIIPWHCDTYAYAVKKFNVPSDQINNIRRSIVFMQDWCFGQTAQFGDSVLSHWSAGAMYSWRHEAWHGLANFGNQDVIAMQITSYEPNNVA